MADWAFAEVKAQKWLQSHHEDSDAVLDTDAGADAGSGAHIDTGARSEGGNKTQDDGDSVSDLTTRARGESQYDVPKVNPSRASAIARAEQAPASIKAIVPGGDLQPTQLIASDGMQGNLLKKGQALSRGWNRRYFVLIISRGELRYYKRKPTTTSEMFDLLGGVLLLAGAQIVPPDKKPNHDYFFQIKAKFHHGYPDMTRVRTAQLRASTGDAMVTWMSAVGFAIERASAAESARLVDVERAALEATSHIQAAREIAASVGQDGRKPARSVAHSTAAAPAASPAQARDRSASTGSDSEKAPKRKLSAARLMQAVAKRGSRTKGEPENTGGADWRALQRALKVASSLQS